MKKIFLFSFALLLMTTNVYAANFSDVQDGQINKEALDYLKQEGIVQGYGDGTFRLQNRINRAEFTKIVIESLYSDEEINKCKTSDFADVPLTEWYAKYVCMARKNNIVSGYPDGTFKPTAYINFAEASKIVAEAKDTIGSDEGTNKEWFAKYVKGLEERKAIPSTVQFFDKEITRGDMVEMMYRLQTQRTDKVSSTYDEITNPFPTISSCSALKEKMDVYHYSPIYPYYGREEILMIPSVSEASQGDASFDSPQAGATSTTSVKSADSYSQTNVQVQGVDEADVIKNDGEFIYLIKGDEVRIVKAYPASELKEVARVDFNVDGFYPREMYVTDNRLIVIGQASHYYYAEPLTSSKMIAPYPYYGTDQTKLFVYDISNHSNIKKLREVSFDGYYQNSRRIDDQVYLVLNAQPDYWNWDTIRKGEDFLPMMKDGDKAPQAMVGCTDIRYFPGHQVPRYLITASLDVSTGTTEIERDVFLGNSDNIYASTTDLFVASTIYDDHSYTDWNWNTDHSKTHIFRFTLNDGKIDFKARGEVPGTILNQFSMDQNNDYFRIATTTGNLWGGEQNPSKNHLFILDGSMKQVGSIQDIAPGEKIYSTRFMGNRAYMVTFKKVDPLFVFDLSNPKNPKILGKLKIPGYSDYLHPYDENHLIGFGKDAIDASPEETVSVDFAWYQGMKMAMFDVTNPANPIEKDKVLIGDRGTESELLHNHKALLFDKEKGLLAFPVTIVEKVEAPSTCSQNTYSSCPAGCVAQCKPSSCTADGICTADCDGANSCIAPQYDQYETTFSGALVYDVNENGFKERGRITHFTADDILKAGDYWGWDYNKAIQRILYIGEYLYTVAQGGIKASTLDTVKEVKELGLLE